MATTQEPTDRAARALWRVYPDVGLGVCLLAIVSLMIVPLPTWLLDLLLASNIALGVVMLLVALSLRSGLGFAAMPSVLLVTTLYRLALNISSTRLILLDADAGQVIRAFGDFVVRGNYAVGAVVFLILTLVQYIVVARGAERVAEVAARFTLDALPGKQLAIDADLRAGALSPDGARARRHLLERESQFYGAMDGAMKFVKGDAIAGIAIVAINLVAGSAIGAGMRGLSLAQSLRTYGLLTIGEGLVCQIPSLLVSVSAGLVVTRVASTHDGSSLARELFAQLFGQARVLWLAAAFLLLLALVPGLPGVPFALLALVCGAGAQRLTRRAAVARDHAAEIPRAIAPITLELGSQLAAGELAELEDALSHARIRLERRLGLELGAIALARAPQLAPACYAIKLRGLALEQRAWPQGVLARQACEELAGALERRVLSHAGELLGLQETQALLDGLERSAPALVHNLVPKPLSLRTLAEVLRGLLAEGICIQPLPAVLEAVAAEARADGDVEAILERTRLRLRRHIGFAHVREGVLTVHPLDLMIEDALREARMGAALALPPDQARDIVHAVRQSALALAADAPCVVVTQSDVRPLLRRLLEAELPEVIVLSYAELAPESRIESRPAVRLASPS